MVCPVCGSKRVGIQDCLFDSSGNEEHYYQCQECGVEWFSDSEDSDV